jgi:exonuclease VII large subunit
MSSGKKFKIATMASLCMMVAVNVFAQAQNADKKPDEASSAQTTATVRVTTAVPPPVDASNAGAVPLSPAASTGTATAAPNDVRSPGNMTPATPRRKIITQDQNTGQSVQYRQISQVERNAQAAIQKAQDEMQKAMTQLEKELKVLEKNNDPAAIQKLQDELQKAMQKAQEEMLKAKAQLDRNGLLQVGPGGAQLDVFGTGGGFGGGGGGGGGFGGSTGGAGGYGGSMGGFGRSAGRLIMDNRTGQMTVSGPLIMENISDPEAKELRDKEQECTDKIGKIIDHYNSTPATPPGDRAAIKTELQKAVGEQFDIRQQYRELQIKQLEKELARVRESIQNRNVNREQIIKRHIAQLLHEQEDMDF